MILGVEAGIDVAAKIRQLRREAGLTQAELARRAGTSQATISAYEVGTKVPSLSTLERLAKAGGAGLVLDLLSPSPPCPGSLAEAAAHIADTAAKDGDTNYAIRVCADFLTWVRSAPGPDVVTAVADPAPSTGDERFDALVAGVGEMAALSAEVGTPEWIRARSGCLRPWWFAVGEESLWAYLMQHTPPALSSRGVFIDAASLRSV